MGERVLKGTEAKVFAVSILNLIEDVIDGEEYDYSIETGINVFDTLTCNQQISILWLITNGLFREDVPCIELTALNEGAIAAVFERLKIYLSFEIEEMPEKKDWRKLVRTALAECDYTDMPQLKCKDVEEWNGAVDFLSDLILWDNDYLDDNIMDKPLEQSKFVKRQLGINKNYYNDIAEDPDESVIEKRLFQIKEIISKVFKNAR